jgi:hypothetical protein
MKDFVHLIFRQPRKVFGGLDDLLEVLQDEGLGVRLQLVRTEVHRAEVVRNHISAKERNFG